MDIFKEVKKLNLPAEQYLVAGSGPMAARGIRDYKDIDILVTENLYQKLIEKGWNLVKINGVNGKFKVLKKGKFESDKRLWCGDYKPDTKTLIKKAEVINGVPFLPLAELIKFKKALGRGKDLKDIELINNYLQNKKETEKNNDINNYATAFLGKIIKIKIDRPINSKHPKHGFVYEVNYGFVPNTKASDGEEIDAYLLGVNEPAEEFTGKCIAVIHRKDDDDDKLVVIPENSKEMSDEEILKAVNFQEKWFDSKVVR